MKHKSQTQEARHFTTVNARVRVVDRDKMTPAEDQGVGRGRSIKGQGRVTHETHHGLQGAGCRGKAPPLVATGE